MVEEWQNHSEYHTKRFTFENIRAEEDEDRISRLPDCLLAEILSRLPSTKCAIKTGALSKRWKRVWTLVPILVFMHRDNPNADFVSFVEKTLTQRGQLKLKKLCVHSTYNDRFEPQVRNCISYAINCNVEEINMMLWDQERPRWFLLDQCFFINSCFTDLTLQGCHFNPIGAISWKNLRSLCISNARLYEDLMENILSGSPVLETLTLKACYGYRQLNITSRSVKKLVFEGYMYYSDVIGINAPYILSLAIKAPLFIRKLLLINVSSLVEANLNYRQFGYLERIPKEAEEEILEGFILNLRHVKEVKIGILCYMVLCRLEAKGFIFPSNLKVCDGVSSYPLDSDDDSLKASGSLKAEPSDVA